MKSNEIKYFVSGIIVAVLILLVYEHFCAKNRRMNAFKGLMHLQNNSCGCSEEAHSSCSCEEEQNPQYMNEGLIFQSFLN